MNTAPFNPYAPPRAQLESFDPHGGIWRSGKLVRMDREGRLPDRCVACNAPAAGARVSRTLYWSAPAWRATAFSLPLAQLVVGSIFEQWLLVALFWPVVLVLLVANAIVRKRIEIEFGVCRRHQVLRTVMKVGAGLLLAIVVALIAMVAKGLEMAFGLMAIVVPMIVVGAVYEMSGAQAVRIRRLDEHHIWLARTGTRFRNALPELSAQESG